MQTLALIIGSLLMNTTLNFTEIRGRHGLEEENKETLKVIFREWTMVWGGISKFGKTKMWINENTEGINKE